MAAAPTGAAETLLVGRLLTARRTVTAAPGAARPHLGEFFRLLRRQHGRDGLLSFLAKRTAFLHALFAGKGFVLTNRLHLLALLLEQRADLRLLLRRETQFLGDGLKIGAAAGAATFAGSVRVFGRLGIHHGHSCEQQREAQGLEFESRVHSILGSRR
jgi:hypothetical protein